ncbi:MAG: hypothetical protein ACOX6N_02020 [Patescibacteria group bacterium]|jgi:hypothetical protein
MSNFERGRTRGEKIDKFLDTLGWYFSEKSTPTGLFSTIGRIDENLKKLNENVERLNLNIEEAGKSSDKLTLALNKITLAGVIVAAIGLFIAVGNLAFEILKFSKLGE